MKKPSNSLQHHFEGFLPDLEPGELEASWQVVEPHLPVKRRRAGLWLAMAAGVIALLGIITFTNPGRSEDTYSALNKISAGASPDEVTASPPTNQGAVGGSGQPASGQAPSLENKEKSSGKDPLQNTRIPARRSAVVISKQNAATSPLLVKEDAEEVFSPVSENSGSAITEIAFIDSVHPDVLPSRMLLSERSNLENLDLSVTAIARPQSWSRKTALTIFAGPLARSTDYSSGKSGILPGWSAGLTLERGLGRKWMVYLSAQVSDELGSYSEREEYFQEVQPAKMPLTSGGPTFNSVPRYISVSDEHKVTPLLGYQAAIGAGFAVFAAPRVSVNLLLGVGIQRLQYKPEWNRTYGEDTVLFRPHSTAVPTGPAPATFLSANPVVGESDHRITSFFINPGVRFLYRMNHRLAFVSQVMIHAPVMPGGRIKENYDAQRTSVWIAPAQQLRPVRAHSMMLHFGISFRL